MKRILVISNLYPSKKAPYYGSFVKNFVDELIVYTDARVDVCVLKGFNQGKLKKLFMYTWFYLRIIYYLIFFRYDFVYVHLITHATIPIAFVSKFKKLNLIFNIHGEDLLVTTPLAKKLLEIAKPLLYKAKFVVVPSFYFKDITLKLLPQISPDKLVVSASGGVKEEFFIEGDKRHQQPYTIGYVSRIDRGKGWNIFVQALSILAERGVPVHGVMIGGGAEIPEFKQIIKTLKNGLIEYIGPVAHDDLNTYYSKMDLFVFPTLLRESLGLVGLEAMATHTPVVGSHIGGLTDYIKEDENGYFFIPGDAEDLANKIEKYCNLSVADKIKMGKNARNTAENYKAKVVACNLFNRIF